MPTRDCLYKDDQTIVTQRIARLREQSCAAAAAPEQCCVRSEAASGAA